jgi:tRNA threonylcarbamoyladenosine biosynthesis protein TsaB
MQILAIDSCTEFCSVSLYNNGSKSSRFIDHGSKSSSHLIPLCDEVFKEQDINTSELDLIIYTKGPGAFTGVRICVGVVQGISLSYDIPTMGISTLELIGYSASLKHPNKTILIAQDARMSEVYWGTYHNQSLVNEDLDKPADLFIERDELIGVGTGFKSYSKELYNSVQVEKIDHEIKPIAEDLIDLYFDYAKERYPTDKDIALPQYLRNNVAQKSLK